MFQVRLTVNKESISTTCLRAACMLVDLKSAKKQSSHLCIFALLRSKCVKAAHKMVVKLTQDSRLKCKVFHFYILFWVDFLVEPEMVSFFGKIRPFYCHNYPFRSMFCKILARGRDKFEFYKVEKPF